MAQLFEQAGASLLTVHGRTKEQKSQLTGVCDWGVVAAVKKHVNIPVLLNGGIETLDDVQKALEASGCDGVMSAEGLLENPALFSKRRVPRAEYVPRYLDLAEKHPEDQQVKMCKKHCFQFLLDELRAAPDVRSRLGAAKSIAEVKAITAELFARESLPAYREAFDQIPNRRGWYRRHRAEPANAAQGGSAEP